MTPVPTPYDAPATREPVAFELEVKRSRFIAWVARAADEEQARDLVERARTTYPDASHHCSAFIVEATAVNPVERSSDDGEPSGTAGTPMLDALRGSGLRDAAVVVTRYFGGVKLGAGGLVHAYSEAVAGALELVPRVRRKVMQRATASFPHAEAGRIEAELRRNGVAITDVDYGARANYALAFAPSERERVDALIAAATRGSAEMDVAGYEWVDVGLGG